VRTKTAIFLETEKSPGWLKENNFFVSFYIQPTSGHQCKYDFLQRIRFFLCDGLGHEVGLLVRCVEGNFVDAVDE
jgi:hypothetical protein